MNKNHAMKCLMRTFYLTFSWASSFQNSRRSLKTDYENESVFAQNGSVKYWDIDAISSTAIFVFPTESRVLSLRRRVSSLTFHVY